MGLIPRGGSSPLQRTGTPARGFRVSGTLFGVILIYPLLLAGAAVVMHRARGAGVGHRGWPWFVLWGLTGALFMFSLVTGFSIGLFLFPVVTIAVFWLAANAPGREAVGFAAGSAAVLIAVFALA